MQYCNYIIILYIMYIGIHKRRIVASIRRFSVVPIIRQFQFCFIKYNRL